MKTSRLALFTLATALLGAPALAANKVSFKDPTGDDKGPGKYVYPTDTAYKRGSFDLTDFSLEKKGDKAEITVGLNTSLEDAWKTGNGFSVQMIFVFIDTDGKEGSGSTDSPPGLNVKFAPQNAWEKLIIISPQAASRVKAEVGSKGGAQKDNILVPLRVKGSGRKISATVDASGLQGEPSQWRYQVLVQSNEGFPSGNDLLTRKVNEYEGQHRFGGGNDGDCDPHVMDLLAGAGKGDASEEKAQYEMLSYECAEDGTAKKAATLTMVGGEAAPVEKK
ncbi:glucodextranase DOMON-like domain-containing protein [Melittangium boletus]|uniref:Membrane-anchored protein n=1 Tax=Melittangium boletus DSM 14713 TaxID=1294270 RepID=A0A250ICS0_9BACT|nr:glucodextranase DOMON-like domain-containing protein [Melittangium boletus]ATB28982.1 membrane-anchored protein [Melittangium boletus DSM 14713]